MAPTGMNESMFACPKKLFLNIFRRIDLFTKCSQQESSHLFSIQKYSAKNKFAKKSHFEKDEEEEKEDVANVSICFRDSI